MVRQSLDSVENGIKDGGRVTEASRFVDDQAKVANTEVSLQQVITKSLSMNLKKGMLKCLEFITI